MGLTAGDLGSVDLTDPATYVERLPHDYFALLRAECPVYWHSDTPVAQGFWAVTKHEDIITISRDIANYSSAVGFVTLEDLEPDAMALRRSMIETDPPEHTRLRRLVSPLFTPKAIEKYRQSAERVANQLLDHALESESFDWATDVCEPLPIRVFVEIMGIEERDADFLARTANQLVTVDDPELAPPPEAYARARARGFEPRLLPFRSPAALDLFDFGRQLAAERRSEPRGDLLTRLVEAEWDGDRLTDSEFVNFFQLLIFAGNETTRTSLQQGMLAFVENPGQLEALRGSPELIPNAVEEVLRWATPIYYFRRTAVNDVELRGIPIRSGDKVVMYYISGNYDEKVFDRPREFNISRELNPNLTFGGGGPHFCLGAWLARMQVAVMLEAFIARGVRLVPASEPRRLRSSFTNGLKSFRVRAVRV